MVTAVGPLGSVKRQRDGTELARRDLTLADQRRAHQGLGFSTLTFSAPDGAGHAWARPSSQHALSDICGGLQQGGFPAQLCGELARIGKTFGGLHRKLRA